MKLYNKIYKKYSSHPHIWKNQNHQKTNPQEYPYNFGKIAFDKTN